MQFPFNGKIDSDGTLRLNDTNSYIFYVIEIPMSFPVHSLLSAIMENVYFKLALHVSADQITVHSSDVQS